MHPLEERIGYKFRNSLLLAEALTHSSLGHEMQRVHFDNQRLEYLGDAVLQVLVSEDLYRRFPDADEGILSRGRARLVSGDTLAVYAKAIHLGDYLIMGRGDESSGGRHRISTLGDAFEALVGAMYLDGGLSPARTFFLEQAREDLATRRPGNPSFSTTPRADSRKSSRRCLPAPATTTAQRNPSYAIVAQVGPDHARNFTAQVDWNGITLGRGQGASKGKAESAAALDALHHALWTAAPGPAAPADPLPES